MWHGKGDDDVKDGDYARGMLVSEDSWGFRGGHRGQMLFPHPRLKEDHVPRQYPQL